MTADELRALLVQRQVRFEERQIPYARQFRCADGEIFNVWDSGKISFQGKLSTALAREVQGWAKPAEGSEPSEAEPLEVSPGRGKGPDDRIFIVYGHDQTARDGLELMLRRMGMRPVILAALPAGGDTIIEKLERYLGTEGQVGFACVLLTPDDEGRAVGAPGDMKYRGRQNVVLELGMVLARLGRPRVAILHKASVELPSDIHGLLYIPFRERVEEAKASLFQELQNAGYRPDAAGLA